MSPTRLTQLRDSVWNLDEFVAAANELLPDYLPKDVSGRVADDVNPRLVRHYTTQGMVPEPRKEGREARYLFEHMLSLLVVRRLLAEGFSSAAIKRTLEGTGEAELRSILTGGVEIRLIPQGSTQEAEARLTFLDGIRAKAGLPARTEAMERASSLPDHSSGPAGHSAPAPRSASPPIESVFNETRWTSFTLAHGLEIHVREDFSLPATRLGDEQLLQLIKVLLLDLEQKQKKRS